MDIVATETRMMQPLPTQQSPQRCPTCHILLVPVQVENVFKVNYVCPACDLKLPPVPEIPSLKQAKAAVMCLLPKPTMEVFTKWVAPAIRNLVEGPDLAEILRVQPLGAGGEAIPMDLVAGAEIEVRCGIWGVLDHDEERPANGDDYQAPQGFLEIRYETGENGRMRRVK